MIVITGAGGALNGATADHLLTLDPGAAVAVTARDPLSLQRFRDRGIEVRRADYADPASLPPAFEGADQLLLVSSNDPGSSAVALHRAAIDAAVSAGVGRVLYTSHQGAAADSPFRPARDHAATEDLLAASGLPWTALRNGFYAHTLTWVTGPWRQTGVIEIPVDGPVSWTAREDAAEGAAAVLAAGSGFDGPVTLTAPAAPTFAELADAAAHATGRPVRVDVVGAPAWVAGQVAAGRPEAAARFTLGIFEAAAAGFFAGTDPLLPRLLGRAPRSAAEVLTAG